MVLSVWVPFALFLSCLAANDWFSTLEPTRTLYVSPLGGGDGSAPNSTLAFSSVTDTGLAGDLYWLVGGTYSSDTQIILSCSGDPNHPCAFRCMPNERCIFNSIFEIKSSYTWLWGFEIQLSLGSQFLANGETVCLVNISSNPNPPANTPTAVYLINNIFYPPTNFTESICSNNDTGTVIYGNIRISLNWFPFLTLTVYGQGGSNLHITNDFAQSGSLYKYIVANVFVQPFQPPIQNKNVDGVSANATDGEGAATGLYFTKNIFANGSVIIGSMAVPDQDNLFIANIFSYSQVGIGVAQPTQVEVKGNYFFQSTAAINYLWGLDYNSKQPTTVTVVINNSFVGSLGTNTLLLGTGVQYLNNEDVPYVLTADLQPTDIWNFNNYYGETFIAQYDVNYVQSSINTQEEWNIITRNGGNQFDVASNFDLDTSSISYFVVRNEYDPTRLHLALFDTGLANPQTFDLCCFLQSQTNWTIYRYDNIYGTPLATQDTGCANIQVDFGSSISSMVALILTQEPVTQPTLRNCGAHWIQDILPSRVARVVSVDNSMDHDTVTAAVAGAITGAILIVGSVWWYYTKKEHDALEKTITHGAYGEKISELADLSSAPVVGRENPIYGVNSDGSTSQQTDMSADSPVPIELSSSNH